MYALRLRFLAMLLPTFPAVSGPRDSNPWSLLSRISFLFSLPRFSQLDGTFRDDIADYLDESGAPTFAELKTFAQTEFAKGIFVESYIHGSSAPTEALLYTDIILNAFSQVAPSAETASTHGAGSARAPTLDFTDASALSSFVLHNPQGKPAKLVCSSFPEPRRLRFGPLPTAGEYRGGSSLVQVPTANPDDTNSAILTSYQLVDVPSAPMDSPNAVSEDSIRAYVLSELLALAAKDACFNTLRTQEQLGYVAYCQMARTQQSNSFNFIVQGSKIEDDPAFYDTRIENFIRVFHSNLTDMSAANYSTLNSTMYALKTAPPLTMVEAAAAQWRQVIEHTYVWNQRLREAAALGTVGKADLIALYATSMLPPGPPEANAQASTLTSKPRSKIAIEFWGKGKYMRVINDPNIPAYNHTLATTAPLRASAEVKSFRDALGFPESSLRWGSGYACDAAV